MTIWRILACQQTQKTCDFSPFQQFAMHSLPSDRTVRAKTVLGGLHHEYRLEQVAA